MEINTIILRAGYAESLSVSYLIFQMEEESFSNKKEAWDSFLHFLIEKFKSDIEWNKEDYGECGHDTAKKDKFCAECGKNLSQIKFLKETKMFDWVAALFSSDCDRFGTEMYDLDTDAWIYHVNFANITGTIEIESHAVEILTFEMSQWAKKNDPEFFTSLNPNDSWDLAGWIGEDLKKEMGTAERV